MMTVRELISQLEGCDPDAEVRIATQPGWPLAFYVERVTELRGHLTEDEAYDEETGFDTSHEDERVVWLAASHGNCHDHPYAPKEAWGY